MKIKDRKLDTRNKIELGGLVIKAKLDYLQDKHKDVILGVLVDAYNKINDNKNGDKYFNFFKQIGTNAFAEKK